MYSWMFAWPSYNTLFLFILCFFVMALLIWVVCVHLWYPFWAKQPVLHSYDIWRRLFLHRPLVLQPDAAALTQSQQRQMWYRPKDVETWSFVEVPDTVRQRVILFLQGHALESEDWLWTMPQEVWENVYVGSSLPCFLSVHQEDGVLTSRPVKMRLWGMESPVYYVDMLVSKVSDKQVATSCALFQTHEFRQRRHKNNKVHVSLFRKEGEPIAGIVPLLSHFVAEIPFPRFAEGMSSLTVPVPYRMKTMQNTNLLYGLFETVFQDGWLVVPERTQMDSWLQIRHWFLYVLLDKEKWVGLFLLKRLHITDSETGHESLELMASWCQKGIPKELWMKAWLIVLQEMQNRPGMPRWGRLRIPYRGMNEGLVGEGTPRVGGGWEHWYLYNMMSPCVGAGKAMVVL